MLFEVKPNDPVVYLDFAVLIAAVTLLASYAPVWRASRIEPVTETGIIRAPALLLSLTRCRASALGAAARTIRLQ